MLAAPRSFIRRALLIGLVWCVELCLLFVVIEAVSSFFLPAGLCFYSPQKQEIPSERRIFTHQPNQHAFTVDQPFVTNALGFRDSREVPADKQGEFRIYSGGDSLAEGLGVAEEDTYARRLESSLSRTRGSVRVINAGTGAYGTWQEVDLLEEKGLGVHPDVAVIEFYWNDLYVTPTRIVPLTDKSTGRGEGELWAARLLKRSRVLSLVRERFGAFWYSWHPTFDWTLQRMIFEGRTDAYLDRAFHDVSVSLARFKALADEHHFEPVLLILPMTDQVRHSDAVPRMQERLVAIANEIGVPTVDPLTAMRQAAQNGPELFLPWDQVHLSQRGHQVVAGLLEHDLDAQGLLPH